MSNKLEAALGAPANTFTDAAGDTYAAESYGSGPFGLLVEVRRGDIETLTFFKSDATKIIALIAEAAK